MMTDHHRFIITRRDHTVYYGFYWGDHPVELYCETEDNHSLAGNIYAARVDRVAEEIGGAFLDIGQGQKCYFSLPKNGLKPVLLSPEHEANRKHREGFRLFCGDIILVQVTRDALKTKLPQAEANISIAGKYFVITLPDRRLGVSQKIHSTKERSRLLSIIKDFVKELPDMNFGIIARTNASQVPGEELSEELRQLAVRHQELMRRASIAPGKTLLYQDAPYYITCPRDLLKNSLAEIVTDQRDIYDRLMQYYKMSRDEEITGKLRLYEDEYELWKLYRMESHYKRALSRNVWLDSGAGLVIEPTEAMVVIDVNTGGVTRKKEKEEDLFYQINREAAREIAGQLRLRNLSGIIVIDFINMKLESHRQKLLDYLRTLCANDRVLTQVVDITALNLVEMTRQKKRKPLHEQWKTCH